MAKLYFHDRTHPIFPKVGMVAIDRAGEMSAMFKCKRQGNFREN